MMVCVCKREEKGEDDGLYLWMYLPFSLHYLKGVIHVKYALDDRADIIVPGSWTT